MSTLKVDNVILARGLNIARTNTDTYQAIFTNASNVASVAFNLDANGFTFDRPKAFTSPAANDSSKLLATTEWVKQVVEAMVDDYVPSTYASNVYTVAMNPVITTVSQRGNFAFKAAAANTGSVSIADGAGTVPLYNEVGGALVAGDIAAGAVCTVVWDAPTGAYQLTEAVNSQIYNSPALTGAPTAPTATAGTNTTQVATTAFVQGEKPTAASQAEMESGTEAQIRSVSPLRVAQAIAALGVSGIGYGQTWINVAASRSLGVTYTNSTGKPIEVSVTVNGGTGELRTTIGGVVIGKQYSTYNTGGPRHNMTFIVPNNTTYKVDYIGTLEYWTELR